LKVPLLGAHQAQNAATAIASLDALAEQGIDVTREDVERGWSELSWPARVEVVSSMPWTVIDGAHNVASAAALAETLDTCFPIVPRTLIFGTTREKDMIGQLRALLPRFARVIATRYLENPRSVDPEEVASAVDTLGGPKAIVAGTPAEAIEMARKLTPKNGLICVTGSLFLAAESRAWIAAEACNLHSPATEARSR